MTKRIEQMLGRMNEAGVTHALIQKPKNMRYLTGYTGEGSLLVSRGGAVILTDFRYVEQAGRQAPDARVIRYGGDVKQNVAILEILKAEGASSLAVEEDYLTMKEGAALAAALPGIELKDANNLPEAMRIIKEADELENIRAACAISCKAFEHMLSFIHVGLTEKEVQLELDYTMLRLGAEAVGFDTIACSGVNGSLPHAIPSDHVIREGELVTMDFGAQVNGYTSDMTRTVAVGKVSDELRAIYDTVLQAQLAALEIIRPGVICRDVDKRARDIIDARYQGAFGHSLGHGVGLDVHEQPGLNFRDERPLQPGHVVTIEPGIYLPGLGGCRIEDMGVVTENGFDNYITAEKQLIEL